MTYFAVGLLLFQVAQWLVVWLGNRQMRTLPTTVSERAVPWPSVSIVIAARDEEAEIERALQSVLHLDYPSLEVIVVNDRSSDGTGAILRRLQGRYPRLKVLDIKELPSGWLGKNHALQQGARLAVGELLLFTDADIVFAPLTLKKAIQAMERDALDHLTLGVTVRSQSRLVNLLIAYFSRLFALSIQPWKARDPKSKKFVGIGAFNLLRRSAYEAIGGHERIRLRPDDDMKLGQLVKQGGFHQDCQFARQEVDVLWYPSFVAFCRGLEKNALAGLDYRASLAAVTLMFFLVQGLLPFGLLFWGNPVTKVVALAAIGVSWFSFGMFFEVSKARTLFVFLEPWVLALFVYAFARATILTLWRRGIVWRDTYYPLSVLKQNKI